MFWLYLSSTRAAGGWDGGGGGGGGGVQFPNCLGKLSRTKVEMEIKGVEFVCLEVVVTVNFS